MADASADWSGRCAIATGCSKKASPTAAGPLRPTARAADQARPLPGWATGALLVAVLVVTATAGRLAGTRIVPLLHDRMLPWILGRSLGVASYLALTAMVLLGVWLRHPWRRRWHRPSPAAVLWAHVALAAATVTLLAGHLTALALDRYAGVGWIGVAVPWTASYRPTPVALGVLALYGVVLVTATAALAGSIGRRVWFPLHATAVSIFCLSAAHGMLAGSDAVGLRWVYVVTCAAVGLLQGSRWLADGRARRTAALS